MEKRILIVEDEADLAEVLSDLFKVSGWITDVAENGKVALERVYEFLPNVILSDINMPEMDGMQLLEEIDKRKIEIPLIFMTGFRDAEKMKRAWGLCAFDFLDKPFDQKNMIQLADNAYYYGIDYIRSARKRFLKLQKVS